MTPEEREQVILEDPVERGLRIARRAGERAAEAANDAALKRLAAEADYMELDRPRPERPGGGK